MPDPFLEERREFDCLDEKWVSDHHYYFLSHDFFKFKRDHPSAPYAMSKNTILPTAWEDTFLLPFTDFFSNNDERTKITHMLINMDVAAIPAALFEQVVEFVKRQKNLTTLIITQLTGNLVEEEVHNEKWTRFSTVFTELRRLKYLHVSEFLGGESLGQMVLNLSNKAPGVGFFPKIRWLSLMDFNLSHSVILTEYVEKNESLHSLTLAMGYGSRVTNEMAKRLFTTIRDQNHLWNLEISLMSSAEADGDENFVPQFEATMELLALAVASPISSIRRFQLAYPIEDERIPKGAFFTSFAIMLMQNSGLRWIYFIPYLLLRKEGKTERTQLERDLFVHRLILSENVYKRTRSIDIDSNSNLLSYKEVVKLAPILHATQVETITPFYKMVPHTNMTKEEMDHVKAIDTNFRRKKPSLFDMLYSDHLSSQ